MFASRFRYMAIADNKQRIMPFPEDRQPRNCQELAYPEAVILTHPKDPALQGEVVMEYLMVIWEIFVVNSHFFYSECHEV